MGHLTVDIVAAPSLHTPPSEELFRKAVSCLPEESLQKLFQFHLIEQTIQATTRDVRGPASLIRSERSYCPYFLEGHTIGSAHQRLLRKLAKNIGRLRITVRALGEEQAASALKTLWERAYAIISSPTHSETSSLRKQAVALISTATAAEEGLFEAAFLFGVEYYHFYLDFV